MSSSSVPYTINDLQELEKIIADCKNDQLKAILENDARIWRSRLVTHLINSDLKKRAPPAAAPKQRNATPELVKPDAPPPLVLKKPTKKDEENYMIKQIKGFKEKVRFLQDTLGGEHSLETIYDALIRCKGREEDALNGILSDEMPKRPPIPADMYKEFEEAQKKKHQEAVIQYEKKLEEYEAKKKKRKEEEEAMVMGEMGGEEENKKQNVPSTPIVQQPLPDITENPDNISMLNERANVLREEIARYKKETEKLQQEMSKLKGNNSLAMKQQQPDNEDGYSRLYLPGEYEAIQNNESRVFTFKPERTFSNEVSHIHFRVAESEFYRLSQVKNQYKVSEVKYIVTPHLINKFEMKRTQIAYELGKKYKDMKPILTYIPHTVDDIEWIQFNNYRPNPSGYYCTNDPTVVSPNIHDLFVLCLVVPGKANLTNNISHSTYKAGYHCNVSADGLHVKVFDLDQILPYYIVKFEKPQVVQNAAVFNNPNPQQNPEMQHLDKEWDRLEQDAKADKFMDDCKSIFIEALSKKENERKLGDMNPSDMWFEKVYAKRYEKEKQFFVSGDDFLPHEPLSPLDVEDDIGTPTPTSKGSHGFPDADDK